MNDYIEVQDFNEATHWIPTESTESYINPPIEVCNITLGKPYKLQIDSWDDETVIIDDIGMSSTLYLCHNGVLVKEVK